MLWNIKTIPAEGSEVENVPDRVFDDGQGDGVSDEGRNALYGRINELQVLDPGSSFIAEVFVQEKPRAAPGKG